MGRSVGKGIFTRSDSWGVYRAEKNGYVYFINEVKNFTASRGWKIEKRDGGNEYVYVLMRHKAGHKKYVGKKAYSIYERITYSRRSDRKKIISLGNNIYSTKDGRDTKLFSFAFENIPNGKPWDYDVDKTKLSIYYDDEYVSDYFATFRECLKYAENKLSESER